MAATLNKPTVADFEGTRPPNVAEFEGPKPQRISVWEPTLKERIRNTISGMAQRSPFVQQGKRLGQLGIHHLSEAVSGLGLYIPDVLASKITQEDTLASAVDKITGFEPTPRDVGAGEAAKFITSLHSVGKILGPAIAAIPARPALQIIVGSGVSFGGRKATEELAKKISTGKPIDIEGIHFDSGIGVLFGAGQVGVSKFVNFVKNFRALPKAQIRPARAEVNAALKHYQKTGDRTRWDAVRIKYAGIKPEGISRIRARAVPPTVEEFGKYPIARPIERPPTVGKLAPRRPVAPITKPKAPTIAEYEAKPPTVAKVLPTKYKLQIGRTRSFVIDRETSSIIEGSLFEGKGHAEKAKTFYEKLEAEPTKVVGKKAKEPKEILMSSDHYKQTLRAEKGEKTLFVPEEIPTPPDSVTGLSFKKYWKKPGKFLRKFVRTVPEFTIDPVFTVSKEKMIVYQDGGRFNVKPEIFGIEPSEIKVGQKIRVDLESYGIKPAKGKRLAKAEEFVRMTKGLKSPQQEQVDSFVEVAKKAGEEVELFKNRKDDVLVATRDKYGLSRTVVDKKGEIKSLGSGTVDEKVWEKLKAEPVKPKQFLNHIDDPKKPAGFVAVPIPKSVQESARRAGLKVKRTTENIRDDIDKFKFYPKAPPEFRNAVRTDMIGALTKATHNVYEDAQEAIWGGLNKRDVQKSVEILYARDQLSRTKLGKGNPEVSLEQSQEILNEAMKNASPEATGAADRFKAIHDKYTDKLIERGVLSKGQRIEDHIRHYVEDYTPEWAPFANVPTRLKRPFRGYAKKAVGTVKEYRHDQESLLASLMEMEHHNLIEDFVETQVKKYDIKPKLSKEVRGKLFGIDARGYAKVPRPGRIYIHEGKRYRAYTPDIPFSRAIYMTENGEAALGSFKNVALIPEDMYNLFRDFSQRGSRAVYLLNRATGYWKTMAILSHFPSFNVNNMVGDTWVAMAQHPKPLSLLEEYDTSIRYLTGRLESKYRKQLDDFITKHDIKQTFAQAELAIGRKAKNPIAWLLRKSYKISDFRESINRVAYASSLLKANQRGEGAKMVDAHDWIDTEGLSTEDALGKIAREVLVDYQAQSKTFRRFVRGGVAPFGTWYFKMSKTMWKWFSKHPLKAMAMFVTLPLAAAGYNRRRKEIQELEKQLPDYIRNRTHFILGEQPDGTIRVLSLQIPQDVLIGTKIFSITVDHANRVISGEMTPKQAAIETMKRWGISEYEGAKYLLTPWIRMYAGLKTGKDPYDKAPVYRRDYDKMTWDEKAKDISAYILKTSVPFLGYTIQTYEKGLPQDVAFKKIMNSLAGKGALGIYDVNKKGQVQFDVKGKKMTFEWKDIHNIHKLTAKEYKYLGQLEDAFVASEQSPIEFLGSQKAKSSLLKIYDVWAERIPDLKKETNIDARIRIVAASLGERLTNRVTKPRIMAKWYQVKISRARTATEKRQIAKEYAEIKKLRLIEVYKALPRTAREIEMIRKIKEMD